ncbi:ferredoxin [bacterium]|nr:ferredoxin [bacterium]
MADGDEFEELSARVAEADHVVLTRRLGGLRAQDFTSLPRDDVPFERWWWYVDLIHEGFLEPQKGFVDTPPPSVSALFGFGVVVEEEAKEEIDVSNLEISRVWIEKGCIVCNACEEVAPEVFDVQEESCIIVPDASFEGVSDILDAADACPVEVIKWEVA